MNPQNATLPAGCEVVPPAHHLFRSASPAASSSPVSGGGFAGRRGLLAGRNSLGPICADYETKCAQGDWCCNTGETCSFDTINGAFLCCGASAGANGCARVCAAGTFQCGSVCCTYGQTCYGGNTVSGYCLHDNQTQIQPQPTAARTTSIVQNFATGTRVSSAGGASATGTSSRSSSSPSSVDNNQSGGVSLGLQIGIGVAVPLAVICIAVAVWFCISRCRRAPPPWTEKQMSSSASCSSPDSPSPSPAVRGFPSLPRNAMIVSTPVQPFEFGQPRTPKTSLPPPIPETPAGIDDAKSSTTHNSTNSTPILAAPRLATPIDLLNAVAGRSRAGK